VRLAEVEEAPDRLAVVMTTLPGHAEEGEERLEVRLAPDGAVVFAVRARARMAHPLARAGKPVARHVVRRFAREAPEAVAWAVRARRVPGTLREGPRPTPSGWVHVRVWDPPQPPVGAVALVHGIGEHALRHLVTIRHLVGAGYRVAAVDLPGHGRSPGPRGHIREWSVFRDAAGALVDLLREEGPHVPVHLLGHSLGAVVALDLLAHRPEGIERAVVLSPPLGRTGLPRVNHHLARTAGRLVPALRLPTLLDVGGLAHDPEVGARLMADPLSHPLGSPRLELEREVAVRHVHRHAADLRTPVLIVHGTADTLADIGGSRRLAARSARVTLHEVEGGFHELHHDIQADRVLAAVTGWLEARTPAAAAV
jgi:alpha-beta hydrolase superfamily lysophospholipase